jgi:hypothetical protein
MVHRTARLVFAAIALLLPGPAFGAVHTFTVPGVVKAAGLNGTNYISDLVVLNGGSVSTTVTLSFAPAGLTPRDYPLGAGASLTIRDVVTSAFGAGQAVGAVILTADQPLVVRGRTYNTASSGTFGVALPVVEESRFLSPGYMADSLWISQDPQGDRGYRTNIAVVFPDPTGGSATVTLYDAAGAKQGQQDFSLDAAGLQQIGVGAIVPGGLDMGRADIQVTSGRAAGYAVVVDNVTGDGSLFLFGDLPGGRQNVVVNGVSRAGGALGTFWRTDTRLYNPSARDAAVTVNFHAAGNSNASPQQTTVTVPAGGILEVVDALGTLMNLPVGSSGALRFQSETPVAILCRTSNLDPTGVKPGTFGAQQEAVPLMSYLTSADAGAVVTGVKQNGAYRTNVGFAAGQDGASYALTLKSANGGVAGTATGSLGVFGWAQPNVGSLFPGTSIPDDAQLTVKVTAGSLDVYDSSIDAGSGDPVITRIAPLPADIPSSASIGPLGGSIRSTDGRLTLKIPAGALAANTSLSIGDTTNGAPQGVGSGYTVTPGGLSLAKPALLVFAYGTSDTDGSAPGSLGLAFQSGGKWYVATGGSADTAGRTLTVPITSTTPATSARASLARRALEPPQAVSPFVSLVMLPKKAAVLQGKQVSFGLWYSGPSSSEVALTVSAPPELLPSFVPPNGLYSWYANGVLLGNNAEGYLTETGPGSVYTAPSCNPVVNPVRVAVRVIDPADPRAPGSRDNEKQALVWVVPPEWTVTWESGGGAICGIWDGGASWVATSKATGTFSVNEGLQAVFDAVYNALAEPPTKHHEGPTQCPCGDCAGCKSISMGDFDAATIESVTGAFNVDTGTMDVAIRRQEAGQPEITMSGCGTLGTKTIPSWPGYTTTDPMYAPVTSSGAYLSYSIGVGAIEIVWELTVKPVLNRCP